MLGLQVNSIRKVLIPNGEDGIGSQSFGQRSFLPSGGRPRVMNILATIYSLPCGVLVILGHSLLSGHCVKNLEKVDCWVWLVVWRWILSPKWMDTPVYVFLMPEVMWSILHPVELQFKPHAEFCTEDVTICTWWIQVRRREINSLKK